MAHAVQQRGVGQIGRGAIEQSQARRMRLLLAVMTGAMAYETVLVRETGLICGEEDFSDPPVQHHL